MLPQVRFELAATVGGDGRWYTEASNPASEEVVCHGCGRDVCQWYYFRPARKAVHASQKVGKTLAGWKWSNKINVHMSKFGILRGKLANRVEVCRCTLARWHWRHVRVQSQTSLLMPGHTYREVTNRRVARTPGCERNWRASNTWWRN